MELFKLLKDFKNKFKTYYLIFESLGIKVESLEKNCPLIAYATKENKIFLNFSGIESLYKSEIEKCGIALSDFQLFVFLHEIMHLYFLHFTNRKQNKMIDNIAKDFAINHFLMDINKSNFSKLENLESGLVSFNNLKESGIFDSRKLSYGLEYSSDSNKVYSVLIDALKSEYNDSTLESNFCSTDTHNLSDSSSSDLEKSAKLERLESALSTLSDSELDSLAELESRVLGESEKDSAKQIGQGSLGIARKIQDLKTGKPSKEIARLLLSRAINNKNKLSTWKKSSRRDEYTIGKKKDKQNKVCFIVDISGSISDDDLAVIRSIIDSSLKLVSRITVRAIDDQLRGEIELTTSKKNIPDDFFNFGGGTDLNDALKDGDKFLHYLIFTDGYIPPLKTTKIKRTLFLYTGSNKKVDSEKCYILKSGSL